MKAVIYFLFLFSFTLCYGQEITVCSWNIQNFGKSKSNEEIKYIANVIKDYDAVAIIEVVAGYGGPQAVARLADELNRKGTKWEYVISDPTTSKEHGTERYAFIWKSGKLKKVGAPWLELKYESIIDREPYFIKLQSGSKEFTFVAFHAIPTSKKPQTEIVHLKEIIDQYPSNNILFAGDFNLTQKHKVFNSIKKDGYQPILTDQKTSLKRKCSGTDCLSQEYDNLFYLPSKISYIKSGIVPFYKSFKTQKEALLISDHVPVYFKFSLN